MLHRQRRLASSQQSTLFALIGAQERWGPDETGDFGARVTTAEVAHRLGAPVGPVSARLKRLEERGLAQGQVSANNGKATWSVTVKGILEARKLGRMMSHWID